MKMKALGGAVVVLIGLRTIPEVSGTSLDICDVLWISFERGYRWPVKQHLNIGLCMRIQVDAMACGLTESVRHL